MIDVGVVGGGPAGLATALYAVRAGLTVVVLEPRTGPIDKACGEGLMPAAVTALADLGVDPEGAVLRGIRYVDPGHHVDATFRAGPGRGVRRTVLHEALREAVSGAGIEVVHTPVRAVDQGATAATVQLRGGQTLPCRYVVAADGLHSPTRRALGLDAPTRGGRRFGLRRHYAVSPWTDRVEVHWSGRAEAYVTPVGTHSVGVALLTSQRCGFDQQLDGFPDLRERLGEAAHHRTSGDTGQVRGAGPLRQRSRRRVAGRVLLVGDASGYVDALTGEGIALALAQASAAVDAVAAGTPDAYAPEWRRITRRHAVLTHALLGASRVPPVRRRLVAWAQAVPGTFDRAVDLLAAPAGPLTSPTGRRSVL